MTFENLECWREARRLTHEVYILSSGGPLGRDFGLRNQLQRAAVSVMANIAEGFERQYVAEKLQFYNVGRGSLAEVRSLLYVVQDNYPQNADSVLKVRDFALQTGRLLTGLIQSTQRRAALSGATARR